MSGKNDMVFDTIRSLYMDPCIKFIGVVRRDDIHFDIKLSGINKAYNQKRTDLTIQRIHESVAQHCKTIVYFPFKSSINTILKNEKMEDCIDLVSAYHASLSPSEKTMNANDFKTGRKIVMCATKAYGMGIDVSDIQMVYHHAPTGCLSDYVQEIGRVARDPKITGIAKIDFSEYDFRYTRTLHGLSAIKPYQLLAVLKKLIALFNMNGEKRNMLINTSDFEYIFPGKDVDYDQKVKSCLLLISHDLLNKLGFNAIIVRPKNLFSKSYLKITKAQESKFVKAFDKFIIPMNEEGVYMLNADLLWNKQYSQYSFPNFKRKLADGSIFKQFDITWLNRINLTLNEDTITETRAKLSEFFMYSEKVLHMMALEHKRLQYGEIKAMLPTYYTDIAKEAFIATFKNVYASENGQKDEERYCTVFPEFESIQLIKHGYEKTKLAYLQEFDKKVHSTQNQYFCMLFDRLINLCEILNSLNLADYQRTGGEDPSIFVRINNPSYLKNLVRIGRYSNQMLIDIYDKFYYSVKIFNHFFTTTMSDKQRWDFIEAYFLGANEEELIKIGSEESVNIVSDVTKPEEEKKPNKTLHPQDFLLFHFLDNNAQQFWIDNYTIMSNTRELLTKLRKTYPSAFTNAVREFSDKYPNDSLYTIIH
jgi:hypothetical protein